MISPRPILWSLMITATGCTISPLQGTSQPDAQPIAPAVAPPAAPPSQPGGFGYTVTDPSGKTVNIHYRGESSQRRLSVAVQPNGTVLLTASRDNAAQGMAGMAKALDAMAAEDRQPEPAILAEGDYYAPPPAVPCYRCQEGIDCEDCQDDDLDPVRDGK